MREWIDSLIFYTANWTVDLCVVVGKYFLDVQSRLLEKYKDWEEW